VSRYRLFFKLICQLQTSYLINKLQLTKQSYYITQTSTGTLYIWEWETVHWSNIISCYHYVAHHPRIFLIARHESCPTCMSWNLRWRENRTKSRFYKTLRLTVKVLFQIILKPNQNFGDRRPLFKIDYFNPLLLNLPATQTNHLQLILNSAACAVAKTPKFHHITLILKYLHWLKINVRIKYKVLYLTYKSLKTGQPSYLHSLLSFPSHCCTRSSSLVTLRPSLTSHLKIANRSYYHSAPVLWNNLPSDLRHVAHHIIPSPILNSPDSNLPTSLFLIISFILHVLLSLYSTNLSHDWYLRYSPNFVVVFAISF